MLVFLGGGSVAAGGLGMLGGLAVITGGAALVGAAGLLPLLFISKLDKEDLTHLGISSVIGPLAGATGVFAAWTIAGTLGVAESLSGAAAISATIAALGGLSVITGGAALVASGVTFLIWSFLQSHKTRNGNTLRELETRSYTLAEFSLIENLDKFITDQIKNDYQDEDQEYFIAPLIPLDKLANALSSWASIHVNEKILGLIDTSFHDDAKEGVIFTNQRIIWKSMFVSSNFISYQELTKIFCTPVYKLTKGQHDQLSSLQGILGDSNEDINDFLFDITQEYSRLNLA